MTEPLEAGDLFAYRIHDDVFGVGHVVFVEHLATKDQYHTALLDVAEGIELELYNPEGSISRYFEERPELLERAVVIDHIALSLHGIDDTEPVRLGRRDVDDDELLGYEIWLNTYTDIMLRQGRIGVDVRIRLAEEAAAEEELYDDDEAAEEGTETESADDDAGAAEVSGESSIEAEGDDATEGEETAETMSIQVRPWHVAVFERGLGNVLMDLRDQFDNADFAATSFGAYMNSVYSGDNGARIAELLGQLTEGDYAAGQELMNYGDEAVAAIGRELHGTSDPQVAEDMLNILCDCGSLAAYAHIGDFFARNVDAGGDLRAPAVRGFCYAVMLTGGVPDPLRHHIAVLDGIRDRDFADDIASARAAIASAGTQPATTGAPNASADPFGAFN